MSKPRQAANQGPMASAKPQPQTQKPTETKPNEHKG